MVGATLACGWHIVGLWLVFVGSLLAQRFSIAGSTLAFGCGIGGAMLGDGWHNVVFCLAVNVYLFYGTQQRREQ